MIHAALRRLVRRCLAADARAFRDGYDIAKQHSKPNFAKSQVVPGFAGVLVCRGARRGARVQIRFIAMLKLPFKFYRHDDRNKPANGGWDDVENGQGRARIRAANYKKG